MSHARLTANAVRRSIITQTSNGFSLPLLSFLVPRYAQPTRLLIPQRRHYATPIKATPVQKPASKVEAQAKVVEAENKEKGVTAGLVPPAPGDLAKSSVFADEEEFQTTDEAAAEVDPAQYKSKLVKDGNTRMEILKSAGLYPREATFLRAERIRTIKRRGRLTKAQTIAQTEKTHLAKSHFIKTSVKKMGPLARQITGKTLDHAMTQMRFSAKKASKRILTHLEHAKNEIMVTKGFDPKQTYIQEAWVGRGTPTYGMDYRAKGQGFKLTQPYTSISIVLKEQQTKERLAKETKERLARRKVWVQMPSKPIYGQHQYYTW